MAASSTTGDKSKIQNAEDAQMTDDTPMELDDDEFEAIEREWMDVCTAQGEEIAVLAQCQQSSTENILMLREETYAYVTEISKIEPRLHVPDDHQLCLSNDIESDSVLRNLTQSSRALAHSLEQVKGLLDVASVVKESRAKSATAMPVQAVTPIIGPEVTQRQRSNLSAQT